MGGWSRYHGGAVGFAFGAVWMTKGIASAIVCLLLAGLGYSAVLVAERARAESMRGRQNQTPRADALASADGFEIDDPKLPDEASRPLTTEVEYGWPS